MSWRSSEGHYAEERDFFCLNERERGGREEVQIEHAGVQQVGLSPVSWLCVYTEISVH